MTERFNASSPKSLSIKSITSRPRSPINAITFTSAFVFLAIIPSNVDLPTPEPENIPNLCPHPTAKRESIALIPVTILLFMGFRLMGSGAFASKGYFIEEYREPFESFGCPNPSITRPKSSLLTSTFSISPDATTSSPALIPSTLS